MFLTVVEVVVSHSNGRPTTTAICHAPVSFSSALGTLQTLVSSIFHLSAGRSHSFFTFVLRTSFLHFFLFLFAFLLYPNLNGVMRSNEVNATRIYNMVDRTGHSGHPTTSWWISLAWVKRLSLAPCVEETFDQKSAKRKDEYFHVTNTAFNWAGIQNIV